MTAKLTIALSDEVLEALRANKTLTINLLSGTRGGHGGGGGGGTGGEHRAGSLPARLIEWAKTHGKDFGTKDITKKFKLSRAHASMLLSRLASGGYPIQRKRRGLYSYAS